MLAARAVKAPRGDHRLGLIIVLENCCGWEYEDQGQERVPLACGPASGRRARICCFCQDNRRAMVQRAAA
jgi:hypothetical protein